MKIRNESINSNEKNFYNNQTNLHEKIIHDHLYHLIKNGLLNNASILDLYCGIGNISYYLKENGFDNIEGCSPNHNQEYKTRTGFKVYNYNFLKISNISFEKKYKYVICSYALHLCPKQLLLKVLETLSKSAEKLIIISPNHLPEIDVYWAEEFSYVNNGVTTRILKQINR